MYALNHRQIQMTHYLLQRSEYTFAKNIAEEFHISVRTVWYDMQIIEEWLTRNEAQLVKVPKSGILIRSKQSSDALIERLRFLSIYNRVLTVKERTNYIVIELLASKGELSIADLCDRLYLCRNTITKALVNTREFLLENNLELIKINAKGFTISGRESSKRKLLLKVFTEIIDVNQFIKAMNDDEIFNEIMDFCKQNFPKYKFAEMRMVYQEIMQAEKENNFRLADISFARLTVYLIIILSRQGISQPEHGEPERKFYAMELKIAQSIAQRLSTLFSITFLPEEISAICKFVTEAELFNTNDDIVSENLNQRFMFEVIELARYIIEYTDRELRVSLKEDKKLFNDLVFHVNSAIERMNNSSHISGEYTFEIKSRFPLVYQIIKESINLYSTNFHFDDDEIAHIALLVIAAYERSYIDNSKATAFVVCQEGISLLSILATKLQRSFPDLKLIESCSIHDYESNKRYIDFVISTNAFKAKDTDVIKVSPFLGNEEIAIISEKLRTINKIKQIYKYDPIKSREGGKKLMLKDLITADMIRLNVEAEDWEDAIRQASVPLIEFDKITPAYVDNMIHAVHELGPYIVIMPGIAFAHARPDSSVKETCMSMITLRHPVNFGSKQNDPISIIFAFGAKNGDDHLVALQDLAKLLTFEENIKFIKNETDKTRIIEKMVEV